MIDVDELLRADAQRWQAKLPPTADLDALVDARERPPRRYVLPALAAAVVLAVAVVVALTARSGHSRTPAAADLSEITGVVWDDPVSTGTVVYTDTTMRIFDGCSNGLYHLEIEGDRLSAGPQIGQASTCTGTPEATGAAGDRQREAAARLAHFTTVVTGPATWLRTGDVLVLTTDDGTELRLATDNSPAPDVVGTAWRLIEYAGTDGNEHEVDGPHTFRVDSDGTFGAILNCGAMSGHADVLPDAITFSGVMTNSPVDSTCPRTPVDVVVFTMFGGGHVTYTIRGDELIVSDTAGRLLVYATG